MENLKNVYVKWRNLKNLLHIFSLNYSTIHMNEFSLFNFFLVADTDQLDKY